MKPFKDKPEIKKYSLQKNNLHFLDLFFNAAVLIIFVFSGLAFALRNVAENIPLGFYLQLSMFYLIFSLAFFCLKLPLDYYDGYTLEHKFNLSAENKKEWFLDVLKKLAVSFIIGTILILALYYLMRSFANTWWILAAFFYFLFSLILTKIMPVVILPLFYNQKPLNNPDLKNRLLRLAKKSGQNINNVFEIDLSRQTKKANAALVGLGKTRRILLSDTLLNNYTQDEIEVILAHELAHHALGHMKLILIFAGGTSLGIFYIIYKFLTVLSNLKYINSIYDIAALPIILLIFSALSLLISPLQNAFMRKMETDADKFALNLTKLNEAFILAMEKLTEQNLADPQPSRFIEIMLYDHPPTAKRIKFAKLPQGDSAL